jgi:tryptophan synthase alpha chain
MNRIETMFAELQEKGRSGLACYFTAGDPSYAQSLELLQQLGKNGADLIELGLPFSDPVADGPVIQAAHLRARAAGQTVARTLALVAALRDSDTTTPVVLMGYLNPLMQYGIEEFMRAAARAGVDGLLLVDLPFEHAAMVAVSAQAEGIRLIRMTAPTSDDSRLEALLAQAEGFVYHVALTGTTGAAQGVFEEIAASLARVRRHTGLPLAVGFGIRTPAQAAELAANAELVVVGSALVETFATQGMAAALQQVRDLHAAVCFAKQTVAVF